MTTKQLRRQRLMPRGVPRYIKCYDNGGQTADRYTVAFLKQMQDTHFGRMHTCVGMSANPFHPQGVGQHTVCTLGSHMGKVVKFKDLPKDCRKLVIQDYKEIWRL